MPVRFTPSGDHHERDEYSFYTRDSGSRDFAISRRFGGEDTEDSRTMSLVSTPLQVPLIGSRRSVSPSQRTTPAPQQHKLEDDEDLDEEIKNMQERRRHSVENRRRLEYKTYDEFEDAPLEPLVPTYQPRIGRTSRRLHETRYGSHSPRRQQQPPRYEDEYNDVDVSCYQQREQHREEPREQPSRQQLQDEEIQSILNWRKRTQEPLVHTDFGYEVPPMRKRADPALQQDEADYRSVVGYIAKRKQFAVEDDEDMQYYKNPNYRYRMHGIERPLISDRDVEESMERSKLDRAPMFDMKLRSHVVWEKMNVKFTCTVRGSPTPRVTWYKDMVPLEPSLHSPGKYKISNQYGLHTLEICRTSIEDSGTYRVSMQNRKGEISSYATLLVRRYDGGRMGVVDMKTGYNLKKPTDYPDVEGLNIPGKQPHAGLIDVKVYDELPETNAARLFKSQLENLDFDVKKLIKEAKLDKEISSVDQKLEIGDGERSMPSQFTDDVTVDVKRTVDGVTLDGTTKISVASTQLDGGNRDATRDDVTKGEYSDVNSETPEQIAARNRFKVAIEVNVTNETRRDSFETYEKTFEMERKREAEKKEMEQKAEMQSEPEQEKLPGKPE